MKPRRLDIRRSLSLPTRRTTLIQHTQHTSHPDRHEHLLSEPVCYRPLCRAAPNLPLLCHLW